MNKSVECRNEHSVSRLTAMPVTISVSETRLMGPSPRAPDELPIWGVVFQLNRDDGVGTAVGITLRCDSATSARDGALARLQGFLSEASAAANALTPSGPGANAEQSRLSSAEHQALSPEIDEREVRDETARKQPEEVSADEIDQGGGHRFKD